MYTCVGNRTQWPKWRRALQSKGEKERDGRLLSTDRGPPGPERKKGKAIARFPVATSGNRTRGWSMATTNFTTKLKLLFLLPRATHLFKTDPPGAFRLVGRVASQWPLLYVPDDAADVTNGPRSLATAWACAGGCVSSSPFSRIDNGLRCLVVLVCGWVTPGAIPPYYDPVQDAPLPGARRSNKQRKASKQQQRRAAHDASC